MTCEIIGRVTCPICGEPMQDLRINRNNNLFMFCDNQCKFTMSGRDSKKVLPQLRSGKNVNFGKIGIITSTNIKQNLERVENGNISTAGSRIDGRTNGAINTNAGVRSDTGSGQSWFRGLLSGDDDE